MKLVTLIILIQFFTGCIHTQIVEVYSGRDDLFLKRHKQECHILKVINECYLQIQVNEHKYISKVAGLSFDTSPCNKDWSFDQIRTLKICLLNDLIKRRMTKGYSYLVDTSEKKDYSEILLVTRDYNGHYQLNSVLLGRRSAVLDINYQGPYSKQMKEQYESSLNATTGIFGTVNEELVNLKVHKDFRIQDFPQGKPLKKDAYKDWTGLFSYPIKVSKY